MSESIREFLIQGSETLPYKVIVMRIGSELKASCSCRAGIMGQLCKHRLAILDGDKRAVVSDNSDQVAEVASWLKGSTVAQAIADVVSLEVEKKLIEDRLKRAKLLIAKALK